ncbi:MAG: ADP-glyceromanno-heptose 6-epimerase [Candidatus Omnitrophota bacterium]
MKKNTIVVTGGAGFIGSCFLWKLNKEGINDIIVVDNLGTSEKWHNLSGKKISDYIQKEDFLGLLHSGKISGIKTIVHLGACSSTTFTDAAYFVKNNYEYSKALAIWAIDHRVKFIYASSAATYGDGEFGYRDDVETILKLKPLNMYGYSKQLFDLWLLNNRLDLDKEATGVKFFNVFGPNEYHKGDMMSVVCKKFKEVTDHGCIKLFKSYRRDCKDGEQKRDFIYVKDAVDVLFFFLSNPGKTGIFNLGSGVAHSWNELAAAMFSAVNKKPCVKYIEMPETLREKYQYFTRAEMGKLRKSGYEKSFATISESVKDYALYLKNNRYL